MGFLVLILHPLNDFMKSELPSVGTYFTNGKRGTQEFTVFVVGGWGGGGVIFIIFTDNLDDLDVLQSERIKIINIQLTLTDHPSSNGLLVGG